MLQYYRRRGGGFLRNVRLLVTALVVVTAILTLFQNCSLTGHPFRPASWRAPVDENTLGSGGVGNPVIPEAGKLCPELDPRINAVQVERISPARATALRGLIQSAVPGTVFLLEPGVYPISETLQMNTPGIGIASTTGRREDVILDGNYNSGSVIEVSAKNVTIANLTIRKSYHHLIHFVDNGIGGRVYNVKLEDARQQFVKSSSVTTASDNVEVACSEFQLTNSGRPHVDSDSSDCYTGGIDAHRSRGWWVRDNQFRDIYCTNGGLAEHAVHFWNSSRDSLVERNIILNCARGIGFGLGQTRESVGRTYSDYPNVGVTATTYIGHIGGVIRGNLIIANTQNRFDTGIGLEQAQGALVHHNTIVSTDASTFAALDIRFANSDPEVVNNLVYPKVFNRDGGSAKTYIMNVSVEPGFFMADDKWLLRLDPENPDVKTKIRDQGVVVLGSEIDLDGEDRDAKPDPGADELPPLK